MMKSFCHPLTVVVAVVQAAASLAFAPSRGLFLVRDSRVASSTLTENPVVDVTPSTASKLPGFTVLNGPILHSRGEEAEPRLPLFARVHKVNPRTVLSVSEWRRLAGFADPFSSSPTTTSEEAQTPATAVQPIRVTTIATAPIRTSVEEEKEEEQDVEAAQRRLFISRLQLEAKQVAHRHLQVAKKRAKRAEEVQKLTLSEAALLAQNHHNHHHDPTTSTHGDDNPQQQNYLVQVKAEESTLSLTQSEENASESIAVQIIETNVSNNNKASLDLLENDKAELLEPTAPKAPEIIARSEETDLSVSMNELEQESLTTYARPDEEVPGNDERLLSLSHDEVVLDLPSTEFKELSPIPATSSTDTEPEEALAMLDKSSSDGELPDNNGIMVPKHNEATLQPGSPEVEEVTLVLVSTTTPEETSPLPVPDAKIDVSDDLVRDSSEPSLVTRNEVAVEPLSPQLEEASLHASTGLEETTDSVAMALETSESTQTTVVSTSTAIGITENSLAPIENGYDNLCGAPSPSYHVENPSSTVLAESEKQTPSKIDRLRELRRQPKSEEEETMLAARYAAIHDLGERAFTILCDLEMIQITPNPFSPDCDHSDDDEIAAENQFVN